jgi:hypothetical protein
MGDHTVKVGAVETRSEHIKVQAEQSTMNARAVMPRMAPDEQQRLDDDRLIPNIGDKREMFQDGTIHSPDGETSIPTRLQFIRTRNEKGGVDCLCIVPALPLTGENPLT